MCKVFHAVCARVCQAWPDKVCWRGVGSGLVQGADTCGHMHHPGRCSLCCISVTSVSLPVMDLVPQGVCALANASACMPNCTSYALLLLLDGQLTCVDITYTAEDHRVSRFWVAHLYKRNAKTHDGRVWCNHVVLRLWDGSSVQAQRKDTRCPLVQAGLEVLLLLSWGPCRFQSRLTHCASWGRTLWTTWCPQECWLA